MAGARWILLEGRGDASLSVEPLSTVRAIRILKARRKSGKVGQVRVVPVDVAVQPVDVDQAIADLEARPVGS